MLSQSYVEAVEMNSLIGLCVAYRISVTKSTVLCLFY